MNPTTPHTEPKPSTQLRNVVTGGSLVFHPVWFDFTGRLKKASCDEYRLTDAISATVAGGRKFAGLEIRVRWVDVRDLEVLAGLESGMEGTASSVP